MILVLLLFWGGSVWRRGQADVWADAKTACGAGGGATITRDAKGEWRMAYGWGREMFVRRLMISAQWRGGIVSASDKDVICRRTRSRLRRRRRSRGLCRFLSGCR